MSMIQMPTKTGICIGIQINQEIPMFKINEMHRLFGGNALATLRKSGTYNCMGMVFASRRGAIDIDDFESLKTNDRIKQVPSGTLPQIGAIVAYRREGHYTHVGIVHEIKNPLALPEIIIISKWGNDAPEYLHDVNSVPSIYGHDVEYWEYEGY